jgi:hypothetical protein
MIGGGLNMPTDIRLAVMWLFVAIFAVTALIALLDLAQVIHIRDPARRKWLFGSVIGSVVLAVIGFGTGQFETPSTDTEPKSPRDVVVQIPKTSKGTNKKASVTKSKTVDVAPKPDDEASVVSATVAAWVKANMPPRPTLPAEFERDYPPCAADLRADATATSPTACRVALEAHKASFVSRFYALKIDYDKALIDQQRQLSRKGLDDEEREIYNFLQAENEDLNYPGGKTQDLVDEAETRLNNDIRFCKRLQ